MEATAPTSPVKQTAEHHLFIIWEHGRGEHARILESLRGQFELVAVREMHWSAARVSENFTRFYGQKLPPGSFKEEHCGTGAFLAIVLRDTAPRYENRATSKGERLVNVNTFDAKQRFRTWTGGGHRIHATDNEQETRHDVALLFGESLAQFLAARPGAWDGVIESFPGDLAGAGGWRNLAYFFSILNETVNYLVLRNYEWLPDQFSTTEHGDIDLLTDAPADLAFIVHGEKVFPETHRVHYAVPIGGERVLFDFRFVGDDYYDQRWEKDMLARRLQLANGLHVPAAEDYFYSLLYHALLHKRAVAPDYIGKLRALGAVAGLPWAEKLSFANPKLWRSALAEWLTAHNYTTPRPADESVYFNQAILEGSFDWSALGNELTLAAPVEQLISARMLVEREGQRILSYVFDQPDAQRILKQTTADLAWRDGQFLGLLRSPYFPRALNVEQHDGYSVVAIERVQGKPLPEIAKELAQDPQRLARFIDDCLDLLAQLQEAGVTHRDIIPDNILARDGRPVLIDFGWAISAAMPFWTPQGLGRSGCPDDGNYCDVFAMGKIFEFLAGPGNVMFNPLVAVMTAQERAERITSIPALKNLRRNLSLQPAAPVTVAREAASAPVALTSLPGPHSLEVFPARSRAEFEDLYHKRLAPALEAQVRLAPAVAAPFTLPGHCVVCGGPKQFLTDFLYAAPDAKGRLQPSWRERQLCQCGLNSRQRASFHVLAESLGLPHAARIYCTEQTTETYKEIKRRFPFAVGSEFLGDKTPLGQENAQGVRHEDLTRLTFPDNSFDCIVCLEVLDHIPNYRAALAEMARCLRPGGILLLTTPIHFNKEKTIVRPLPGSASVNDFGWDLTREIRQAGFSDESLNFFSSEAYGYLGMQCVLLAARELASPRLSLAPAAQPAMITARFENDSTETLLARAESLRQQAKWLEAAPIYQTLLRRQPDDMNLWRARIECSAQSGNATLAKFLTQDALKRHPEWAEAFQAPAPVQTMSAKSILPKVSVIIPVFNKIELTEKCLQALRHHTSADLCEVIVWDNASTDGTAAFFQQTPEGAAGVRYFRSETNLGFVGGNNAAAQHARGQFLVLLNNDTEPQPGWLEALLQTVESDSAIGAVGAKLIYPDGKLQEAGGIIFRDASGWNYGRTQDPRDPRFNFPREVDYCSAACLLVRTELFRKLGGFDTRYAPAYYEDTDLCFGLRQAGFKVVYQPRCEIIHHEGATAGQDLTKGFKQYQALNRQKFLDKWKDVLANQPAPDANIVRRASHRIRGQRILVIDPMLPMHDRASGSKRLFEALKLLVAGGNAVTFLARNGQNGERYAEELAALGIEVYAGDAERMKACGFETNYRPLDLKQLLRDAQFDLVILSFWYIAEQYLPLIRAWSPQSRVVIDTVDVHFLRERRQAELYKNPKLLEQAADTQMRELKVYRQADALITVTEDDRATLLRELPESRIFVVPNIHDVPAPAVTTPEQRAGLLFIGGFGHPPNEDAVLYFHQAIWPLVLQQTPQARWTIVGNNPSPAIRALAGPAIQVTGYVPSVEPHLGSHLISIAPLRYGAGMKGKIGEALAHGLPVVTTSIGAEGMGLTSGENGALVADDPKTFAAHIARLCSDHALWAKLSTQGRAHIEANFTPARIARQLEEILHWSASYTSIIILALNQWEHTEKCLQSLAAHTPEPHEIIVVDNGSSDKTPGALRVLAVKNPRIRVVVNRENCGFAGGNNQGLAVARGRHVVLLNNDTVVSAGWLGRMLAVFERHPETGMVGPMSNYVSGPQLITPAPYSNLAEMPAFAAQWTSAHAGQSVEAARLVGFCVALRRDVVDKIGSLDTRFGNGNFEDDDLCIRARLAGYSLRIAQDSFVHHTGGQTFQGAKIDYAAMMQRNWQLFKAKWGMPRELALAQGYRMPASLPAGTSLFLPLPRLELTHVVTMEGQCWTDKTRKPAAAKNRAAIPLPPCALLGHLAAARELLTRKEYRAAWQAAAAAMSARPFHPEARLLLGEIALAAGSADIARQCGQEARRLAPHWAAAKNFLKGSLRGDAKHEWLIPPPVSPAPRLSVCLIVKNEEAFLDACLASVRGLADQIVVVDTGSTDRTIEIARAHGAEVHAFAWCDDFSAARNAALERATGDWILSLDADEELLPAHRETLRREMANPDALAYRLPIINQGREDEGCSYVPRLFRNAPGLFFLGRVHEQAFSSIQVRCQQWG
ncbi:MAG TPA: glycosyltransferase, partial [Verrucomicrobiae bacterium]|nr:glycosyltransferase [Verrucomicrobiae bacterium]